jgi:hypothetical protein
MHLNSIHFKVRYAKKKGLTCMGIIQGNIFSFPLENQIITFIGHC